MRTVDAALSIFQAGKWSRAPAIEPSKVLSRLARSLEERVPELVEITNRMANPPAESPPCPTAGMDVGPSFRNCNKNQVPPSDYFATKFYERTRPLSLQLKDNF
jgi:hypothetical protein